MILISQFSSGWHSNASRFFRTALMAVGDSLHGIAESYCIVVDDDKRLGKVVSVRHTSALINYPLDFFFHVLNTIITERILRFIKMFCAY